MQGAKLMLRAGIRSSPTAEAHFKELDFYIQGNLLSGFVHPEFTVACGLFPKMHIEPLQPKPPHTIHRVQRFGWQSPSR